MGVAAELLAQRERRGVLRVGAPDLDDVREGPRLGVQRGVQVLQRRHQRVGDLARAGHVHGGGIGVVRRLAHVDVIVGVHGRLGAHHAAQPLDGAVRDHLVGVHVRLGARARLPDDQREVSTSMGPKVSVSVRVFGMGASVERAVLPTA